MWLSDKVYFIYAQKGMRTPAHQDLYDFVFSAVRGICDDQDQVRVDSEAMGNVITMIIYCNENDLKFVWSKLHYIRQIAIAIARRNKSFMNIILSNQWDES